MNQKEVWPTWLAVNMNGKEDYGVSLSNNMHAAVKLSHYIEGIHLAGKIGIGHPKESNAIDYVAPAPYPLLWLTRRSQLICKRLTH